MAVKTTSLGIKDHSQLTGLTGTDHHTQYQKESEKDAASGYAGLDASSKLGAAAMPYTREVAASANLKESNDAEIAPIVPSFYTKLKEFSALTVEGTITIKFDIKGDAVNISYGKVYRNGVAVGTEQTDTTGGYVTKTEDIAGWSVGDIVELWAKTTYGSTGGLKNFRLYGDVSLVPKAGLV